MRGNRTKKTIAFGLIKIGFTLGLMYGIDYASFEYDVDLEKIILFFVIMNFLSLGGKE